MNNIGQIQSNQTNPKSQIKYNLEQKMPTNMTGSNKII
jgi:hypothetical protein